MKNHTTTIKAVGATPFYLTGPNVHGQVSKTSDLDFLIAYDRTCGFNAWDLIGIKQFLEDELDLPIDVLA